MRAEKQNSSIKIRFKIWIFLNQSWDIDNGLNWLKSKIEHVSQLSAKIWTTFNGLRSHFMISINWWGSLLSKNVLTLIVKSILFELQTKMFGNISFFPIFLFLFLKDALDQSECVPYNHARLSTNQRASFLLHVD